MHDNRPRISRSVTTGHKGPQPRRPLQELVAMYHLPEGTREDITQFLREMNDSTSERSKRLECLTRSIDIFKTLTRRPPALPPLHNAQHTPSNYARYCYVTCYASHFPHS